jgi:VIT1/CCC1 family predicted Fe2+/Mn2+ transporter
MVDKYRLLALAIAALVFVAFFWCFSDPITGILAAMIALVVQMILFALVTEHTPEGKKK